MSLSPRLPQSIALADVKKPATDKTGLRAASPEEMRLKMQRTTGGSLAVENPLNNAAALAIPKES